MASIYPTTVPSKRLAASITGASSSIQLNNILGWDGSALTSADFGTKLYAVLRNDTNTLMEIMELDPTTIASASITILRRGLKFTGDLTTEVSGNKLTWVKNETIVELGTDVPQLLKHFVDDLSDQTVGGVKTFSSAPKSNAAAMSATELVRKNELDAAALGSITNAPLVVPGNAGETVAIDQLVYLKVSDQEWYLCDADTAATVENIILGITRGAGTDGNSITNGITVLGEHEAASAIFTVGKVFASNTAGGFATSTGTKEVSLGVARTTTKIAFFPRYDQVITEDIQDALAGSSGTPSASNTFVTTDDVSSAGASGKIVRLNGTAYPAGDGSALTGVALQKFGGDGSDGALSITSGTTTIDLGNAAIVTKNYTSISITGTGALAFSNPASGGTLIILKSQGAVTITSTATRAVDIRGIGAAAATAPTGFIYDTTATHAGANGSSGTGGSAGTRFDTITYTWYYTNTVDKLVRQGYARFFIPGAGGGTGANAASGAVGGAGGRGGGALYIECAGAFNFGASSTIDISGQAGTAGANDSSAGANASGAGGGAGGNVGHMVILYNSLTANAGTVTSSGGAGGAGGSSPGGANAAAGGGGGSSGGGTLSAGAAGGNQGNPGNSGGNGGAGIGGGGGGGNGGANAPGGAGGSGGTGGADSSAYLISKNYWFA